MAAEYSTLIPLVEGFELTNSIQTVYTAGAGKKTLIKSISVYNDSASNQTFYLYLIPSAGSAVLSTKRYEQTIYGKATFNVDCTHMLNTGGTIQAYAGANSVLSLHVVGVEIQNVV
jgi:hypothetical protein